MSQSSFSNPPVERLARRRGNYGVDAPYVPLSLGLAGLIFLCAALLCFWLFSIPWLGVVCLAYAVFFLLSTASYLYTTRLGKFRVWADILKNQKLQGNERVLDLGCGRGAVLLMAAELIPAGRAVGIDLWSSHDQSGNLSSVTEQNAVAEGVASRVEVRTGDMRKLPFANEEFDVVLSSLAIHNIKDSAGRKLAIDEAVRVLKHGGKLLLADFQATDLYVERLQETGISAAVKRNLGWRFWYGGPWGATRLVSAVKA